MAPRNSSRQKILEAAATLAKSEGSAHLSLDAIAAKAGLSKGGLLYHFPTKAAVLKALVQQYIERFEATLDKRLDGGEETDIAAEYLHLVAEELCQAVSPPSGLLAALAEDPELLKPVHDFNRALLDRMGKSKEDHASILIIFLVLEGMRCQKMFGTDVLNARERELVQNRLAEMLKPG